MLSSSTATFADCSFDTNYGGIRFAFHAVSLVIVDGNGC